MLYICVYMCLYITPDYSSSGKIQARGQPPFSVAVKTNLSAIFGKSTHVRWTYQAFNILWLTKICLLIFLPLLALVNCNLLSKLYV